MGRVKDQSQTSSENLQELISELGKERPNTPRLKSLSQKVQIPYQSDHLGMMVEVLKLWTQVSQKVLREVKGTRDSNI